MWTLVAKVAVDAEATIWATSAARHWEPSDIASSAQSLALTGLLQEQPQPSVVPDREGPHPPPRVKGALSTSTARTPAPSRRPAIHPLSGLREASAQAYPLRFKAIPLEG
jgi:hypothetical protein